MSRNALKSLSSLVIACAIFFAGMVASAQTLVPPPPMAPPPLWTGNFPGDPANWPNPDAACKAQHDYYNPNATLLPASYSGGRLAGCNWLRNANSNTILPAHATGYCPSGWGISDAGTCLRANYEADSRPQCDCEDGAASPIGSPLPVIGNPVALNYGAKVDREVDYASADGRFLVERKYYSLSEDYTNVYSPTPVPGFGGRWHGVVPGRLAIGDGYAGRIEYMNISGGFSIFVSSDIRNETAWDWYTAGATRRRLSMVNVPSGTRKDFFFTQAAVPNGGGEVRMDMSQGEYILFRRAGPGGPVGIRYLVPVEHGYADGYRLFYSYPDTGEFPSTVSDSLGRQMTLTWADADRLSHASLSVLNPVKVISEIALPDGTRLQYNYGYATDPHGSPIKDRLEGVKRVSGTGSILWARNFLHENNAVPYGLTGKVDQNGNRLSTYSYDAAGLVASTELAGGVNKYTIVNLEEEGAANYWRQVTNPLGHRQDYVFFRLKYLTTAQRVLSRVIGYADPGIPATNETYQYDGYVGDMVIANYADPMGRTLHFDADSQLRPTLMREASGTPDARTTRFTWHPIFDLPTHEERPGLSIDYTYSTTGLLLTETQTDTTTQTIPYSTAGQTRSWAYNWDGNGRLLSINGPKALDASGYDDIASFAYDTGGNLLTSTNALGHVTRFTAYDANGRPGKMTDPNGIDTSYTYDPLGRVKTITVKDPAGASGDAMTSFDYDVEGRVTSITAPSTDAIMMDYDLAGRVTAVRRADTEQIAYTYNAMSGVTAETVKRADGTTSREITRTFDKLGRLLTETLGVNRTKTWAYDSLGNVTMVTAARSNATVQAFDGLNRLMSTVAPDTGATSSTYDVRDNRTSFTDPKSVTTTFIRNGFGDVIREISPDRGTSTYYYDAAGDRIAEIDGRNQRVDITRDALGRITAKTPVGRPGSESIAYRYDTTAFPGSYGVGRLTKILYGPVAAPTTLPTKFKYDHRGNVLIKAQTIGTTPSAELAYTYDLADRITSITYPSGRVVSYTRNGKGMVTSIRTRPTATGTDVVLASGMSYEPFGPLLSATFGNGLSMAQNWGNEGRLASKRLYRTVGGADLSSLTYSYDNDDNITSIADGVDPSRSITFDYDPVDRLTRSDVASGSIRRQDFIHDLNGNRVRVERRANPGDPTPASTATYTLTSGTNRLASVTDPTGVRAISYDGRGNTVAETRPGAAAITTDYDGFGRLTGYQASDGLALLNGYDGLDDRVSSGSAADMRHFIYDGDGRMMGEYGASAADVRAETIWLSPEVDDSSQAGGDDGVGGYAPLAVATGGTLYWVHGNHLGVPIVVTDGTGNMAAPTGYTRVGFPGQTQTLPDLYYNVYRDYDPTTGRYIQADPIGLDGGNSPYLYAEGNPVRWIDPWGLAPSAGDVVRAGAEWWLKRQVERAVTRRIPVVGTALAIGDAIGAAAAVGVFICNQSDPDPCPQLISEIYESMEQVRSRTGALRADKWDLYRVARSEPSPSLPKGTGSYNGHIQQAVGWQNRLRRKINEALAKGCIVPSEAFRLAWATIPTRPGV